MGIGELIVVGPVSLRVCSCNALIWSRNKHGSYFSATSFTIIRSLIARAVVKAVVLAFVRRSWRSVKCLPGTSKPLLLPRLWK